MKFYEMVLKFDDIIDEIPKDISEKFSDLNISRLNIFTDNTTCFFNSIWDKTKDICKEYIETKWIKNLGIDTEELLEDIKFHSIFTIYLSIMEEVLDGKSIEKLSDEYYEAIYMYDNKEPDEIKELVSSKLEEWILLMNYAQHSNSMSGSDLYYCFWKDTINRNEESDELLIYVDFLIFCKVIINWDKCPYSDNHKFGMNFRNLYKFYCELESLIKKTDNEVEKIIRAYTIERFFNISFISKLSNYMYVLREQGIKKYKEGIEECEQSNKEFMNKVEEKFNDKIAKQILKINKNDRLLPYKQDGIYLSNSLLILSKLVSIPMVFSRNKYIEKINESYKKNNNVFNWDLKLECNLYYLNNYMIPLLIRVYFYILFTCIELSNSSHKCVNHNIKDILEDYIKQNFEIYNYKKFLIEDKESLQKKLEEAFQVNITEMVYNYDQGRMDISNNKDIFGIMKELESEMNTQMFNNKYKFETYQLGSMSIS